MCAQLKGVGLGRGDSHTLVHHCLEAGVKWGQGEGRETTQFSLGEGRADGRVIK